MIINGEFRHAIENPLTLCGKHWAILTFHEVHVDTGYNEGSYNETYTRYYAFNTEDEWRKALEYLTKRHVEHKGAHIPYVGLCVSGTAAIEHELVVNVDVRVQDGR